VKGDTLNAHMKGSAAASQFQSERIVSNQTDFFAPIKSVKLKTFASGTGKASVSKVGQSTVILKAHNDLFKRLFIIGKSRQVDLKHLLSYALTSVPASLGTLDGLTVKTDKAKLMHELEKQTPDVYAEHVPSGGALIVDAMAVIHAISVVPSMFGYLAELPLKNVLSLANFYQCKRIDFVTDTYPQISIKNVEHERRTVSGIQRIKIERPEQKTPLQFKKFLACGSNKECLFEFLFAAWTNFAECDYFVRVMPH
jgi:hypothetical protein